MKTCDNDCFNCNKKKCILDEKPEGKRYKMVAKNCEGLGKRLSKAIYNQGMTQAKLAQLTGISAPAINQYVHGDVYPRTNHLIAICKTLNISADWLLGLRYDAKRD